MFEISTSGSFTPPSSPPCPTNVFTRAALIALRTAGSLRPECHYRVDGPVIGTAGNTSPTVIELHATSPTELGLEAKVHTTFDDTAWEGLFDIDLGTAGSIIRLVGRWNNVAIDSDPDAPTVQAQVPWHLGSDNFRDNIFQDATLTGWGALPGTVTITDNTITESTVNLTGKTTGTFVRNQLLGSNFTSTSALSFIAGNVLQLANVNYLGSGSFSFQSNTMLTGSFSADAACTAVTTVNNNIFGGASNGYRVVLQSKTTAPFGLTGNRLFNNGLAAQDMLCIGPAEFQISSNQISAGSIVADGAGKTRFEGNEFENMTITQTAASTGDLYIRVSKYQNSQITVGPANAAVENFFAGVDIRSGIVNLNGPVAAPARNDFLNLDANNLNVTVAATATAGLNIEGGYYSFGTVTQNRTAGTAPTRLRNCSMLGLDCALTDNGTVDPGGNPVNFDRIVMTDSTVNLGNLSNTRTVETVFATTDMMASTINITGLPGIQFIEKGRMLGATLTNATFSIKSFTIDNMIKTLTADQQNRAASVAFDNFV